MTVLQIEQALARLSILPTPYAYVDRIAGDDGNIFDRGTESETGGAGGRIHAIPVAGDLLQIGARTLVNHDVGVEVDPVTGPHIEQTVLIRRVDIPDILNHGTEGRAGTLCSVIGIQAVRGTGGIEPVSAQRCTDGIVALISDGAVWNQLEAQLTVSEGSVIPATETDQILVPRRDRELHLGSEVGAAGSIAITGDLDLLAAGDGVVRDQIGIEGSEIAGARLQHTTFIGSVGEPDVLVHISDECARTLRIVVGIRAIGAIGGIEAIQTQNRRNRIIALVARTTTQRWNQRQG